MSELDIPVVGERMRVTYDSVHSDDRQVVEGDIAYSGSRSDYSWYAEIKTDDDRVLRINRNAFGIDVKSVNREGRATEIGEAEHDDVEQLGVGGQQ